MNTTNLTFTRQAFTAMAFMSMFALISPVHAQTVTWLETVAQPEQPLSFTDQSNGDSELAYAGCGNTASADGRYVVFASIASNLIDGDTNHQKDIFLKDFGNDSLTRISVNHAGEQLTSASHSPCISRDGNRITFVTASKATLDADHDGEDVYLYDRTDRANPTLTLISKPDPALGATCVSTRCFGYGTQPAISGNGRYVVFSAASSYLVSGISQSNWRQIYRYDVANQTLMLVSRNTAGAEPNRIAGHPSISNDGSKIAFSSTASDLIASDTNGNADIFVFDANANAGNGGTKRVSQKTDGTEADRDASWPFISGDGTHVLFYTTATNLPTRNNTQFSSVYRATVADGGLILVNTPPGSTTNNRRVDVFGGGYVLSDDGNMVVFASDDKVLTGGSGYMPDSVLLKDINADTMTKLSPDTTNARARAGSWSPRLSPDGDRVYFLGSANDQVADDTNNVTDVFVHNLIGSSTTMLSTPTPGTRVVSGANGGKYLPYFGFRVDANVGGRKVSNDGRYVVFASSATNLVDGAVVSQNSQNIYLHDRIARKTVLVTKSIRASASYRSASAPSISADGKYVVFHSNRDDLIDGVPGGSGIPQDQVFLYDVDNDSLSLVSVAVDGTSPGNRRAVQPSISADGTHVVFVSSATDLIAGGVGDGDQVYIRDLVNGTNKLISQQKHPAPATTTASNGRCNKPRVSADGARVVFDCESTNLVAGDTNGSIDVFLWEAATETISKISQGHDGSETDDVSQDAVISDDGLWVAFSSEASNVVAGVTGSNRKVYRHNIDNNQTTVVSVDDAGTASSARHSGAPSISADGRYVAFVSMDPLLGLLADRNEQRDIVIRDTTTNTTRRVSEDARLTEGQGASVSPSLSATGRHVFFDSTSRNWALDAGVYAATEWAQPFLVELEGFAERSSVTFEASPIVVSDFSAPQTISVIVNGQNTTPADGHVVIQAESGERCVASTGTPVTSPGNSLRFECELTLLREVAVNVSAGFAASTTHEVSSNTAIMRTNQKPEANAQSTVVVQDESKDITLSGSDPDREAVTYRIVDAPQNGTLSGNLPFLTYTPNAGYIGNDSFTFVANDGRIDSEPATVSITVQSKQPEIFASGFE